MKQVRIALALGAALTSWIGAAQAQILESQVYESPDGTYGDQFGAALAVDGDTLLVGAPRHQGKGAAYALSAGSGQLLVKLEAPGGAELDLFGESVAISEDFYLVGAWGRDDAGPYSGAAYLFSRSDGSFLRRLRPEVSFSHQAFGFQVALTEDYALVGATGDEDEGGVPTGSVVVFSLQTGKPIGRLLGSDAEDNGKLGISLQVDGDLALVGARNVRHPDGQEGAVYLFSIASQQELWRFVPPAGSQSSHFGDRARIALNGDHSFVSNQRTDTPTNNAGAAFWYSNVTGQFLERLEPIPFDPPGQFGGVCAAGEDEFLVADSEERIHVFSRADGAPTTWLEPSGPESLIYRCVALQGDDAFVGCQGSAAEITRVLRFDLGGAEVPGEPDCFGDGSGAPCPCGGSGAIGRGCANDSVEGSCLLTALGQAALSDDSLRIAVRGLPPGNPGILLRGADAVNGGLGSPSGDGLLCVTGSVIRSQVFLQASGVLTADNFRGMPFGEVSFGPGLPVRYQFWYRDPANPCTGAGFNYSNAWSVTWGP